MKFNELLANSPILQNAADITDALKSLAGKYTRSDAKTSPNSPPT